MLIKSNQSFKVNFENRASAIRSAGSKSFMIFSTRAHRDHTEKIKCCVFWHGSNEGNTIDGGQACHSAIRWGLDWGQACHSVIQG